MKRVKRKMSDETKEKVSKGNRGKIVSEETKAKLKAARANRIITAETKAKQRKSMIEYWKKVIWVDENKELNPNEIKEENKGENNETEF